MQSVETMQKQLNGIVNQLEQGDASAQCNLGLMYYEGRGGVDRDNDEAKKWYRKSAEQGNSSAQSALKHL